MERKLMYSLIIEIILRFTGLTIKRLPQKSAINRIKEFINYLWGIDSKSYKVQMNDLIRRLIILLNKEINDETEET